MKKTILFLITCLTFTTTTTNASHIFGADLTFICQGNGNYLVTFDFYRDCFGIPAPVNLMLSVDNVCGLPAQVYTLSIVSSREISLCTQAGQVTTCSGGTLKGIQKYTYQTIVTLPDTCSQWRLGVTMSARNAAITTFINPDFYNLYVEATINNTFRCDTSPVFSNDPIVQICANQPYCFDPGLFDAEHDSMVASFIQPKTDPNAVLPYDSAYSLSYPMDLSTPLLINQGNGIFCFTPLSNGFEYTQYAIKVDYYKAGLYMGSVERDMGLYITNCAPDQPVISGINGTFTTDTFACVNTPLCFNISTSDPTPSDSTFIDLSSGIPGSTFNVNPGLHESASFCWTPTINDVSSQPYCFNVNVLNKGCQAIQSNQKTFCITVLDSAGCATVGVHDINKLNTRLNIYPQPANDKLNIEIKNSIGSSTFCFYDLLGKMIFEKNIQENENNFSVNIETLPPGIYIAYLKDKSGMILSENKIIKLKN